MYRKRLKNVYDLLEAGNNKKVIQEVDKLIASSSTASKNKKPSSNEVGGVAGYDEATTMIIAKALKSLALVRTGRKPESDKLLDELLDSNTTDENALSIIMQYCKETQQLSKIVTFYENAVTKCQQVPALIGTQEHEDIMASLFYAYVRNRDFNKQQQISLKLYKQTNKMMFCFWNAASYAMMSKPELGSTGALSEQQKAMYLQLGEKILQKAYDEQKMEYNGEFLLYLNILEEKKKYEEALKVIEAFDEEKHLSKIGLVDFKIKKKMTYFKSLKKWSDLLGLCETYFQTVNLNVDTAINNLDDWLTYQVYLDALIQSAKEASDNKSQIDVLVNRVRTFLQTLKDQIESKEANKASGKSQGPYLARIELINQLEANSIKYEVNESMLKDYLSDYINVFCCKPGFYYEIVYFRELIEKFKLKDFVLSKLKEQHDSHRPFKGIKSIYSCLSYWQLHSYFGKQDEMKPQELQELSNEFEKMYGEALEFGKDLLSTGFQYADEFIIMACHIRFNLYKTYQMNEYNLPSLISMLKQALVNSPSNYQLKLLLLNIYSYIGAYDLIKKMYDSMEIKNIQNYSTANLLLVHNMRLGSYQSAIATYTSMDQFFTSNLFDMANFLVNCYKFGTFLKAFEICSFMNTIKQSLTLNLCLVNSIALNFINSNDDESTLSDFKQKLDKQFKELSGVSNIFDAKTSLILNDDLILDHNEKEILYHWNTHDDHLIGQKQYALVISEQKRLLKLRNIMVRYLDSCLTLMLDEQIDEAKSNELKDKLALYKKSLVDFDYKYDSDGMDEAKLDRNIKIYITKSFYLNRWPQLNLNQLINLFTRLSADFFGQEEKFLDSQVESNQKALIDYKDELKKVSDQVKVNFERIKNDVFTGDAQVKLENLSKIIESLSSSFEALSFCAHLSTYIVGNKHIKPLWSEKLKKSKKKKGLYLKYGASIEVLFEILELLCKLTDYFASQLKQDVNVSVVHLTETHLAKLNQIDSKTKEELIQSYAKTYDEIRKTIQLKLNSLLKLAGNLIQLTDSLAGLKIEN